MKNRKLLFFLFVFVLLLMIVFFGYSDLKKQSINNFEDCVKAGNKVMQSYPRQCTLPSGKFFVEQTVQEK